MLNCNRQVVDGEVIISLEGELDTISSRELDSKLDELLGDATKVTVDLGKLEYITSAGLRILLQMENTIEDRNGSMKILHVSDEIKEIFAVTGFMEVLTIK